METILHNYNSETQHNVKLVIEPSAYVVVYGRQREEYAKTPQGLMQACDEYISCVDHCKSCEGW